VHASFVGQVTQKRKGLLCLKPTPLPFKAYLGKTQQIDA